MDEQQIAASLRQNLPVAVDPALPTPPPVTSDEQSSLIQDAINELTTLKLGQFLGSAFPDDNTSPKLKYIYEQLTILANDDSQEEIMATAQDLLTRLGLNFAPDRLGRLYLWLKLNQQHVAIEQQMEAIRG